MTVRASRAPAELMYPSYAFSLPIKSLTLGYSHTKISRSRACRGLTVQGQPTRRQRVRKPARIRRCSAIDTACSRIDGGHYGSGSAPGGASAPLVDKISVWLPRSCSALIGGKVRTLCAVLLRGGSPLGGRTAYLPKYDRRWSRAPDNDLDRRPRSDWAVVEKRFRSQDHIRPARFFIDVERFTRRHDDPMR